MFSKKLYDHLFDLDDLLRALCNVAPAGAPPPVRWLLSTRTGELTPEFATGASAAIAQGDDENHWHILMPLTDDTALLQSFLTHPAAARLTSEARLALDNAIAERTTLAMLWTTLDTHPAGSFLYARLKDIALAWLDERDLIPPSMRHVGAGKTMTSAALPGAGTRIKFDA